MLRYLPLPVALSPKRPFIACHGALKAPAARLSECRFRLSLASFRTRHDTQLHLLGRGTLLRIRWQTHLQLAEATKDGARASTAATKHDRGWLPSRPPPSTDRVWTRWHFVVPCHGAHSPENRASPVSTKHVEGRKQSKSPKMCSIQNVANPRGKRKCRLAQIIIKEKAINFATVG